MGTSWTIATTIYKESFDELELGDIEDQVIAIKTTRRDSIEFKEFGPGRIKDLEINLEKIYEV